METKNIIPYHQKAVNAVLDLKDKQVVYWWLRRYNREIWLWFLLLLPFVIATIIVLFFPRRFYIDLPAAMITGIVLVPFELFFLTKLFNAYGKSRQVNAALRSNIKQVVAGILQDLKPTDSNHLAYRIDDNIISVLAPLALKRLAASSSLKQAEVMLETLYISEKNNLLLSVTYRDVPVVTSMLSPVSDAEKAPLMTRWSWSTLKIAGWIMLGIMVTCFLLADKNRLAYLTGIIFLFLAITTIIACVGACFNHVVQQYRQKISVTGIVTEVIAIYYEDDGPSTATQYWYRIGMEIIPAPQDEPPVVVPGARACFEHFIDKRNRRRDLISITEIPWSKTDLPIS